jgi:mRNA-degrading endonuclease toxin of MazEF toxin-antitoxin module
MLRAMFKRFLEWIELKEKLHAAESRPPLTNEREVWWFSAGENVGSEINGKSSLFSRPCVIYKKLSNKTLFVIPMTSKERTGSWFVEIFFKEIPQYACLNQVRAIDYKRLLNKMGTLSKKDFSKIRMAFWRLYK